MQRYSDTNPISLLDPTHELDQRVAQQQAQTIWDQEKDEDDEAQQEATTRARTSGSRVKKKPSWMTERDSMSEANR